MVWLHPIDIGWHPAWYVLLPMVLGVFVGARLLIRYVAVRIEPDA